MPIKPSAADFRQIAHPLHPQTSSRCDFPLDLFVDRAPPASARSWRCSSTRCKARFKKSISSACCPILRSSSATRSASDRLCPQEGACPQLLLFVIPAVKLARTYLQLPCQPRHWLPHLHATHRRQLKFPGKPPFRHTNPPSLNSIGELAVSKLGSTPTHWSSVCSYSCSL